MSPTNPLSKSVLESMGSLDNIHCLRRRLCAPPSSLAISHGKRGKRYGDRKVSTSDISHCGINPLRPEACCFHVAAFVQQRGDELAWGAYPFVCPPLAKGRALWIHAAFRIHVAGVAAAPWWPASCSFLFCLRSGEI